LLVDNLVVSVASRSIWLTSGFFVDSNQKTAATPPDSRMSSAAAQGVMRLANDSIGINHSLTNFVDS
jgi:hypothetical protein